jgi:hypothetical protein
MVFGFPDVPSAGEQRLPSFEEPPVPGCGAVAPSSSEHPSSRITMAPRQAAFKCRPIAELALAIRRTSCMIVLLPFAAGG